MSSTAVLHIGLQALIVASKIGAPILLTSLAVGFAISLFQSVTQIQEVTLTFLPKLAAVSLVLLLSGRWMISTLIDFTHQLFNGIPALLNN